MAKQKSKYADVSTAQVTRQSVYDRPGHYLMRVNRVEEGTTRKKQDFIAIQKVVVHTFDDSTPGRDYARGGDLALHSVGEEVTDLCMVANIAFESRMKGFITAAGDLTEQDFEDEDYPGELMDNAVSGDQPLAGTVVEVRSETIVKKDSQGKPEDQLTNSDIYTRVTYVRSVPASELREILDDRALTRFFPDFEEMLAAESAED